MENNINKTIHIEFYGLPGCGKSTISHALALYLKENNFCVEEPTYELDHCNNKIIRRIKKILQYILFYFTENKLYRKLKSSIKENEYFTDYGIGRDHDDRAESGLRGFALFCRSAV